MFHWDDLDRGMRWFIIALVVVTTVLVFRETSYLARRAPIWHAAFGAWVALWFCALVGSWEESKRRRDRRAEREASRENDAILREADERRRVEKRLAATRECDS